ncbi:transcriptional repressor [Candidatus Kaiserbacteria bacterium]|nr:transcriptional repressor [Candidatus Kaiserbacteria bacterium]
MSPEDIPARIRQAGFRATTQRIALFSHLASLRAPHSILDIAHALKGTCDQVTVYRMIDAFEKAGIVREVNIHGERPLYELADAGDDHHHLVCTNCRKVEDFVGCDIEHIVRDALAHSQSFASVTRHSFDLYGLCHSCSRVS